MKSKMLMLMLAGSFISLYSCSGDNSSTSTATDSTAVMNTEQPMSNAGDIEKDIEFARKAADGGMMEVTLGELVKARAATQSVKSYGNMLLHDHSVANDELKALAMDKKISIPTTLSEDKQKMYDALAKKTGTDFDKSYIDMMVDDHKEDIDEFKKEANDGNDVQLKAWANDKLPILQMHLDRAQAIQDSLKSLK